MAEFLPCGSVFEVPVRRGEAALLRVLPATCAPSRSPILAMASGPSDHPERARQRLGPVQVKVGSW